jgi:hypothetical protein
MRIHLTGPLLAATLSLSALAPRPAAAATPDTAQLRRSLGAALGEDFEITRTELSSGLRERGGTFWLVHARPRRSGYYALRYRYDYRDHHRPENPLYTHVEHSSAVRVGEQGCWRRREGKDVCVGDTVILPFVVNDYTGHTFQVTRRALSDEVWPEPPLRVDTAGSGALGNPLAAHLRYLGSGSGDRLRRNGGGWRVYSATFEAVAPGRFNFSVSSSPAHDDEAEATPAGSIPVIIVPRGQPVTVLLANETVEGRDEKNGFGSHTGNQYLTTPLLLQPGDPITLEYATRGLPGGPDYRLPPPSNPQPAGSVIEPPVPVITRYPFRLELDQRFNAWIADHLPARP